MSAITPNTSASGPSGVQDVRINSTALTLPVLVQNSVSIPVDLAAQSGPDIDVNITGQDAPLQIDDSTPIQVEGNLTVSSARPSITNTLTKANMTAVGGGVYQIAQTLGDLGAFQNIGVKYIFNSANQPTVRTIIVGSIGGKLAFLSSDSVTSGLPSGDKTISHKFCSLNTFQQASNFDNPAVAPFNTAAYWNPSAAQTQDIVGSHIGFDENSQVITWIDNNNGGNPDFTINFLATRI